MEMELSQSHDVVGKEFDKWLDWNGNADSSPPNLNYPSSAAEVSRDDHHTAYPASPSSTAHSDSRTSLDKSRLYTASTVVDLPTPTHSSGSPELPSYADTRLSGDTLREYATVTATRPILKRKLSPQGVTSISHNHEYSKQPARKRPHNVIEKRYRANLNEKIAELRDSVPSLRILKKANPSEEGGFNSDNEDLDGLTPSNKLNKASILTKAVEYIRHLELRNKRLDDENKSLKDRLQTLDKVLSRGGTNAQRAAAFTSERMIEDAPEIKSESDREAPDHKNRSKNPPQGLIPVPDSWRKLREAQPQEHYGHIYENPSEGQRRGGKWPMRLMLGSLASLMVMEGFGEADTGSSSKEKGLFGIPLELLDGYRFLSSPRIYLATFAQFCRTGGVLPLMKGFTALTILAFIVFAYLFNSKPTRSDDVKSDAIRAQQVPSLASPIEVRRRAWSTSMQTLRLPHHHFFSEWLAVTAEWLKYAINLLFGAQAYVWTTGRSAENEKARIKAWDIAIDAQLAGGDPEVSRSRVVLTSFGSGTLPRTPLRLMLKALHCRVLLWRVGGHQSNISARIANRVATFFADREWRRATKLLAQLPLNHPDRLPNYVAALLRKECDDVFIDSIVQRAYNLMYDRPTSENAEDRLMDVIVEDHAIRSPLDAVAAWFSTQALRKVLVLSVSDPATEEVMAQLSLALEVAPPGSAAQTRALALHAVLSQNRRPDYYARAANALPSAATSPAPDLQGPYFIDSSTPASARPEISTVLDCARTLILLESQSSADLNLEQFEERCPTPSDNSTTTLLSFVAVCHVARQLIISFHDSSLSTSTYGAKIQSLCTWLRNSNSETGLIPPEALNKFEALCGSVCTHDFYGANSRYKRRMSNLSNDTGYESADLDDESTALLEATNHSSDYELALRGAGDWQV